MPSEKTAVISWNGDVLVVVEDVPATMTATELLDWYADWGAFEREPLSACFVQPINYRELANAE